MPSSISSSELDATRWQVFTRTGYNYVVWIRLTLAALAVLCFAIEAFTRFGFAHVSRIEARISHDYKAARSITREKNSVLLVGNSLLLEGIDYPRLRRSVAGHADPVVFPIEQTEYLDWYYGMRRLFAEGSQPKAVILCMSAGHLISLRIRGDYSAYYLFRLADIPHIRRDVGYDLTKTSNLVLARFSHFYAGRSSLRNFVLFRTDPAYAEMLQQIATAKAQFPPDGGIERTAEGHLTAFQTLCALHGARFAFLLAPGFGQGEGPLKAAGARSRTDVMVPFHLNELSREKFRDGFHLNASGAQIFTDKVALLLKSWVSES